MSNYYTERIRELIVYLIEEGELTLHQIAVVCRVSLAFVRKVKDNYDMFYGGLI